jgi:hypothetical protein
MSVQKVFVDQPAVEFFFIEDGIKVQIPTETLKALLLNACNKPAVTLVLNNQEDKTKNY